MNFKDIVMINLQRFKNRKLRSSLTILGIGVGIGIVYFLVSLVFGVQQLVIDQLVTSDSILSLDVRSPGENVDLEGLSEGFVSYISSLPEVDLVAQQKDFSAQIIVNSLTGQSSALGVPSFFFALDGISESSGRLFGEGEKDSIVVNRGVLDLFGVRDPSEILGENVLIKIVVEPGSDTDGVITLEQDFTIAGVVDVADNSFYLPLEVINEYAALRKVDPSLLKVKVVAQEHIDPVKERLQAEGMLVSALTDTLDQLNKIFNTTQIIFGGIGIVALFIAAVGMFNTMTISLLERTREVGIMKSIGATDKDIWGLFLFESVIIGFLGGISGIVLGAVSGVFFNFGINILAKNFGGAQVDLFATPGWFLALVLCTSLSIGFVTGFYPARRASNIDPLDALRYE